VAAASIEATAIANPAPTQKDEGRFDTLIVLSPGTGIGVRSCLEYASRQPSAQQARLVEIAAVARISERSKKTTQRLLAAFAESAIKIYFNGTAAVTSTSTSMPGHASWLIVNSV
jgi:hypothetical protein